MYWVNIGQCHAMVNDYLPNNTVYERELNSKKCKTGHKQTQHNIIRNVILHQHATHISKC